MLTMNLIQVKLQEEKIPIAESTPVIAAEAIQGEESYRIPAAQVVRQEDEYIPKENPPQQDKKKATSPTITPIGARLDALEEAACLEKGLLGIKKRVEALELSIFDELQEGKISKRVSSLEFELS
mmetsp:Transcript_13989/g.19148  ORF Transcript_13989/g.19148 Transcript_13989/m.19148 type:complete len:125 (-) Transcript_13989:284-658(-)